MRILIDVLHPAHVHFFRHFRTSMLERGHEVVVTARDKDLTLPLLGSLEIPAEVLSSQRRGRLGLARELLSRTRRLTRLARETRPDVMVGIMGPSIALAGRRLRIPAVVFYDTENAGRTNRWVYPMAAAVCTPDCYRGRVRGNHITYPSYHELAYLHPDRFTPDPSALGRAGLEPGEPFSLVRFVGWQASHDIGEAGLGGDAKRRLIRRLQREGRVLISSEAPLPDDLAAHAYTAPVEDVHHLIAPSRIVVGESATMASEAAVLGIPALYVAETGRGYVQEQQDRYGLVRHTHPGDEAETLAALDGLLAMGGDDLAARRARLLADKIDPTPWMVGFIEGRRWER